jgi:hypothetical protein
MEGSRNEYDISVGKHGRNKLVAKPSRKLGG